MEQYKNISDWQAVYHYILCCRIKGDKPSAW
ncbi:MAG: hypothetical protein ACI8R4_002507 [Paracoccaceae bacterium]|jgi:hypothetical protein